MERQFLILDADDTLWENNIYFETAFDQFCEYLAHSSLSPAEIRAVLDEIERVNAKMKHLKTPPRIDERLTIVVTCRRYS